MSYDQKTFLAPVVEELLADEAASRRYLAEVDFTPLLMVTVQLGGDRGLLDASRPHISGPWNYRQLPPLELRARVIDEFIRVLREFLADPSRRPPRVDAELLEKMMEVAAGETIGPDYVAMLANDMGYEAKSAVASKAPTPSSRVRVAVVGAGMSGLLAGIQLQRAGIEYTIFERNPEVGGTWYESVYPGCGVDTPNHFYNYSFYANKNWTRYFAKGPEIQKYFVDTANEFVLRGKIRFSTRVTRAAFDESRRLWTLSLVGPDGKSETHEAEVVIFAVGLFGDAVIPDIPGIKAFAGRVIHTSRWPKGESIAGKHVVRRAGSRATATPRISSARVRSSNFSASS